MFKALLKKQFKETLITYTTGARSRGSSKARSASSGIWMVGIWALILVSLGASFFLMCGALGRPIFAADLPWLYFAYVTMLTVVLGVISSVFAVVSGIYNAKDNDLLLSMPIPPHMIVFARMLSCWVVTLLMQLAVLLPAFFIYCRYYSLSAGLVLQWIIVSLAVSLAALTLSCIFGWAVAIIASKLKGKSIVRVLIALVFIAVYYVFYFNLNKMLGELARNALTIGVTIRKAVYPIYAFGMAFSGNWIFTATVLAASLLIFSIAFYMIARSFTSIATRSSGEKKKAFSGKTGKKSDISSALLRKEFKRYISSSNYMLNASIGTFLMPIAAVALIIKGGDIRTVLEQLLQGSDVPSGFLGLICAVTLMFMCAMNDISAPSLSLEGNTYWVLRSLPIDMKDVAKAKIKLHLILTAVPFAVLLLAAIAVLKLDLLSIALSVALPMSFMLLQAYGGLAANIKFPRMDWINETAAVKQGASTLIGLMGSIIIAGATIALYFTVLWQYLDPRIYALIASLLFALMALLLRTWIMRKGIKVMESL